MSLEKLRAMLMTNHPPSVLCHCWLGHQTVKISTPKWPIICQLWQWTLFNKLHRSG